MSFFRVSGILETISTISLFFIAMPLKYIGGNEILVEVIGPIHGFLWIIYIALLGIGYIRKEWNIRAVILGGFLSILPGGPIWLERRIQNEEYLPSIT